MNNKLCRNLNELRLSHGYTFKTLEQLMKERGCDVTASTLHRYEVGKIPNVPYDSIIALADIFQVSPCALMGWVSGPLLDNVEMSLLQDFRKLNQTGKGKASDYVRDLSEQAKYTDRPPETKKVPASSA